jgi:hypothetical protein
MNIEYLEPLSRGWDRMKKALFKPFDLRKWCVVGFTAFLAGLTEWHGGGSHRWTPQVGGNGWREFFHFPVEAREWLADNPLWATLILIGVVALVILSVILTWLSSRGKFMFLDNVTHDRSQVTAPWHEYQTLGDSLFVWRLILGFVGFAVFIGYLVFCFLSLYGMYENGLSRQTLAMNVLTMGLGLFGLILVAGYVTVFLEDFVVVIMYKQDLATLQAMERFWNLFKTRPLSFLLYGILVFFLHIFVVFLVILVGLFTCCIGFFLLAIPYVNSVVLLPVSYTLRTFSLEFLAQFGAGYNVFSSSGKTKPASGGGATKKRAPIRYGKK